MAQHPRSSTKWDSLTPAYRQRLARAGITQRKYLAGDPLKAARGHARTPENRMEVVRHPERFGGYIEQLDGLRDAALTNLRRQIGYGFAEALVPRFDIFTIVQNLEVAPRDVLTAMRDADLATIQENARRQENKKLYFIDGILKKRNLWWYH